MAHTSDFESNAQQPEQYLQLVVHAGPLAGKGFPITGNVMTFGRDPDNDICLSDDFVSRHHARLVRQGEQIILEDFGSANGTKINGKEVVGTQVVQPSDVISIGSSVFGIKGFSALSTVGMTQVSSRPPQSIPASPVVTRPPSAPQVTQQQNQPKTSFLVIGGVAALIIAVIIIAVFSLYFMSKGTVTANIPSVIITAPSAGSQIQAGQIVTVQAIASDPDGVVRAELWVRGLKVAETVSPSAAGQPTLTTSFQWNVETAGSYTLEIRAYNKRGAVNIPTLVTVNVGDGVGDNSPTATLTPIPERTATTEVGSSSLTTLADLRVRSGPGIEYDLLGILPTNIEAEIIGQDEARQWWQIRFAPASDSIGWVVADVIFSTATNVGNVPIAISPPVPTGTPTLTPTPTSTPTSTSVPATGTPLPTNTSIPPTDTPIPTDTPTMTPTVTPATAVTTIEFNVSPTSIKAGKCVTVTWSVNGVKEVHINDIGVGGSGSYEDCPLQTKTYTILVLKNDGATYTQEIIVDVNNQNQVLSSGVIVIGANQTVDFDSGVLPGDDFLWYVNVNGRKFEAQGNVKLSPQSNISSLNNLSRADCAKALFGVYNSMDASDNPIDPTNALTPGRSACYKTNSGRLGKMRFPEKSVDSLKVEWLTWE